MLSYDYISLLASHLQAVKLYERCLIPCANYSEFWIRYAEYVDAKGGREIANYALGRASSCFVKVSSIGILFCLLHLLLLSLLVAVAACIRNLHSSVLYRLALPSTSKAAESLVLHLPDPCIIPSILLFLKSLEDSPLK